jgi:parvulin-like peptidyl-prolyl isomerase
MIRAALLLALLTALPAQAQPRVVDRVVAVVGDSAILLSELRARGSLSTNAQARELLSRMIDEELLKRAAARSHLTVTSDEIDRALGATRSEPAARAEIARKLLENKLLKLRRVYVTDKDLAALRARLGPQIDEATLRERAMAERLEAERTRYLEELRRTTFVEVRL